MYDINKSEKFVTGRKTCHRQKNVSHLGKCVTFRKFVTLRKMFHTLKNVSLLEKCTKDMFNSKNVSELEKSVAFGKSIHSLKSV